MKVVRKIAPQSLPPAEADLVAEGGKVLVSDDAPVQALPVDDAPVQATPVDDAPVQARPVERRPTTRLHLNDAGKWIARVLKS